MKLQIQLHRPQSLKNDPSPRLKQFSEVSKAAIDCLKPELCRRPPTLPVERGVRQRLPGMPLMTFSAGVKEIRRAGELAAELQMARAEASDPATIDDIARHCDAHKARLFSAASADALLALKRSRMATAMECMNTLHGKAGHNQNTVEAIRFALRDPKISKFLTQSRERSGRADLFSDAQIIDAARWHGLADQDVFVSVMTGKQPLHPDYLANRSASSAEIFRQYALGDEPVADLIGQIRGADQGSSTRLPEAQLLDVVDQLCGVAAKPFVAKKDGSIDVLKVWDIVHANLQEEKTFVALELLFAVQLAFIYNGKLEEVMLVRRNEDGYIRP